MKRRGPALGEGLARRAALATLLAALLFALLFGLWRQASFDPVTGGLENALLDLRFRLRGPRPAPERIVVVAIDEDTVNSIGTMAPLRAALAEAIDHIAAAGPLAIAVNLLLLDQTAADARLAQVLAASETVLLAVATTNEPDTKPQQPPPETDQALARSVFPVVAASDARSAAAAPDRSYLPHPGLAGAAVLGHVNITRSNDRVARLAPLAVLLDAGGGWLPALPLSAVRLGLEAAGEGRQELMLRPGEAVYFSGRRIDTDRAGRVALNHYGGTAAIATVPFEDVLEGRAPDALFAGRLVFIGATAESLRDLYATPFAADVPGVEVLATLAGNLLEDRLIRRDATAGLWSIGLALLLSALAWRAARLRVPLLALAASVSVWLIAAVLLQLAFSPGLLWLDGETVLGAILFASVLSGGARYFTDARATHRLSRERANLSRYLSPALADRLAEDGGGSFGGRTHDAAVLFVDVTGYTTLAEAMAPADVSAFLSRLHDHVEEAVTDCGGVIVEFLGDGVLAVFGLPDPQPADAAGALSCGAALLDDCAPSYPAGLDGRPVQLRVSVHYGPIGLALVGSRRHGHFTVTGDTVNVASRLQEVAKEHGADFVASRAAVEAAARAEAADLPRFAPLTRVAMRGRRQATEVWVRADAGAEVAGS